MVGRGDEPQQQQLESEHGPERRAQVDPAPAVRIIFLLGKSHANQCKGKTKKEKEKRKLSERRRGIPDLLLPRQIGSLEKADARVKDNTLRLSFFFLHTFWKLCDEDAMFCDVTKGTDVSSG